MKTQKPLNFFAGSILSVSIVVSSLIGGAHLADAATPTAPTKKFNMSYLFFGDYASEVATTKGSLNAVSPDYFEVGNDGHLKVTDKYSKAFVDEMHKEGLSVTPYLSNNWDPTIGKAGLKNRLAQEIANQVKTLNLDGIDVDIEGLTENNQADLTDFIKQLRSRMPDKEISVAVAANPGNWKNGWQGEYNYKALSNYADYLMIMAYDENWIGDPTPGPVAGLPWVEKSIQYALNQGVSPEKLVLGLPFYGRLWKTDGPTSNGTNVYGISISQRNVEDYVKQYNGTVVYDPTQHTEKATFTIKPTDATSQAGALTLTPGNYVLWYDDQKTMSEKIELVNKYNLKGTGSWSLNHEEPSTWNYFRRVLDGTATSVSSDTQNPTQSVSPPVAPKSTPTPTQPVKAEPVQAPKKGTKTIKVTKTISYKVKRGDCLSKLAKTYHTSTIQIKKENALHSSLIRIGQVLKIKTLKTQTVTVSHPSQAKSTLSPIKVSSSINVTPKTIVNDLGYKVKRGDCLSKIAKSHHISVSQLQRENHLHSSLIRIGQTLKIRIDTPTPITIKTASQSTANRSAKSVHYKVVRGDCLSRVAKRFHTSVSTIKKENGLRSNVIHIGQMLNIK